MENASLDNILNGEPAPEPEAAAPAEVPAEAEPQEQPRDEHGRFAPKGDSEPEQAAVPAAEEGAPPAPSDDDSPTVPRKALLDERNKRQTLESQLAEANRRLLEQPQQPAPLQPQTMPDQYDDPEGHAHWLAEQAAAVAEQRAVEAVQRHHVMVSAEAAKVKYPDYLDKVAVFERLATDNPALQVQMLRNPNPAEYAYSIAKQHEEVSQYGSLDAMLEAKKKEWEAEALERLKASLPAQSAPPTLATERNVGNRSGPAWPGPVPLTELLS